MGMTSKLVTLLLTSLVLILSAGCQLLGGVNVEPVASTAHKPGQVSVYVSVTDGEQSIVDLQPDNFTIYEGENKLDPEQVQLRLLSRDLVAEHHTVVVVDVGGPIEEPGARGLLVQQLAPFIERLRLQQSVSVYGFDGESRLYPFGDFPKIVVGAEQNSSTQEQLKVITEHQQKDSSRNLNGAVVTALDQVHANLTRYDKPIRIGTIVVITRGPDLAGRISEAELSQRLDDTPHSVFALSIGKDEEATTTVAESIGKDGYQIATIFENLESSLAELATMVENDYNRYYLLSYCSPARAGARTLILEVNRFDSSGDEQQGEAEVEFTADGFSSDCDSSQVPRFPGSGSSAGNPPKPPAAAPSPAPAEPPPAEAEPPAQEPPPPIGEKNVGEKNQVAPTPEDSGYAE